MSIKDCNCRGINPECKRCDGKGYYETEELEQKIVVNFIKIPIKEKKNITEIQFDEILISLPEKKVKELINYIVKTIDLKSKLQETIIKSTPWKTAIPNKIHNKIESLNSLEIDKRDLKLKLNKAVKQAELLNIPVIEIKYKSYLSTVDVEIWSNLSFINGIRIELSKKYKNNSQKKETSITQKKNTQIKFNLK